ncbi:MAG TPA: hypothetical protein VNG53_11935 [Bacteroidia bacterium]|nr:hypothetical protein [Bacteroidia bacterium]
MIDKAAEIELLFEKAEDYSKTTLELLQLKAIDKSADVISTLIAQLAIIIAATLAIIAINIGIAFWIGKLLGSSFYGFFIVGGFYAIVAFTLHLFKNVWIKKPINNAIISQMMKEKIK